ncbi:MAG: indole-3-glycerol phosphate synthase TrpC [Ferruginibacter sp.]
MNILDQIIEVKHKEVAAASEVHSVSELENSALFNRTCFSLKASITQPGASGIIAEFKRKSPSKGFIQEHADAATITADYTNFGASGISVLTDFTFFGGTTADLDAARLNDIPLLRKDFMIHPYKIVEAKAMGADVILLIAACLTVDEVKSMAAFAHSIGLEVLLEIHDEAELKHICTNIDLVGVNNRNLKTFEVDINRSLKLAQQIPAHIIKVAESGISDMDTLLRLKDAGFQGFLMGENFMKATDPGLAFKNFINQLHPS